MEKRLNEIELKSWIWKERRLLNEEQLTVGAGRDGPGFAARGAVLGAVVAATARAVADEPLQK